MILITQCYQRRLKVTRCVTEEATKEMTKEASKEVSNFIEVSYLFVEITALSKRRKLGDPLKFLEISKKLPLWDLCMPVSALNESSAGSVNSIDFMRIELKVSENNVFR